MVPIRVIARRMSSYPGIAFSACPIRSSFTEPTQVHMLSSFDAPSELRDPHPVSPLAAAAAPAPSARNFLLLTVIRLTWRFLLDFAGRCPDMFSGH
ncbi:hypothetical protein GCM10009743_50760 [Kribbella swartbergensis]